VVPWLSAGQRLGERPGGGADREVRGAQRADPSASLVHHPRCAKRQAELHRHGRGAPHPLRGQLAGVATLALLDQVVRRGPLQPGIVGEVGSRSHARAFYGASADLSGSGTLRHCSGVSTARACWSARRMLWLSTSSESAIACSTATCSAERPSESRNDMIRAIGLASACRAGAGEPESGVAAAPSGPAVARRSDARSRSRMRLGPRVRRASRPIWKGTVTPPFPALLAPKRPLTA